MSLSLPIDESSWTIEYKCSNGNCPDSSPLFKVPNEQDGWMCPSCGQATTKVI